MPQTTAELFVARDPSLDTIWRSIILFGRNVASYKFALGKSLLEMAGQPKEMITLEALAVPFARHVCEHLKLATKQTTSEQSRFLDACRKFNRGEITAGALHESTARLGFANVIDAFHVVGPGDVPRRFFLDERQGGGGIRITDELRRLSQQAQFAGLSDEVESRWRLVETAWELGMPPTVLCDPTDAGLYVPIDGARRKSITGCRGALNGYQRGRCFYCARPIEVRNADVDHFLPHVLMRERRLNGLDGIWNLVLACSDCNRGSGGKFDQVPALKYLKRLYDRGEYLIGSHHPLRETLMNLTGQTEGTRRDFLKGAWDVAFDHLHHPWEPEVEVPAPW